MPAYEEFPCISVVELLKTPFTGLVRDPGVAEYLQDLLPVVAVVVLLDRFQQARPVFGKRAYLDLLGVESG